MTPEHDTHRGERNPSNEAGSRPSGDRLAALTLAALGVVYGDIGTSPLYALRECFVGLHRYPATPPNVLGVLSLIFWALTISISVKYLLFVLRADNRGEGGMLALLALLNPWQESPLPYRRAYIVLGLFGASLLYGDGVITPAISVLSAVEGFTVATPLLHPFIVPTAIAVLTLLFFLQKRGTARVGALFGPVMTAWFVVIALLGIRGILIAPEVLAALNPLHAFRFFRENGWDGCAVLGGVFLVVTGGEALYADMGHFGRGPIRLAWFSLVLPALVLNYLGQGALILSNPSEVTHPFYHLAPPWALYPLILLATLATVIASQAIISGVFSLTRQAIQLGLSPRMRVVQTSSEEIGQVYVPATNWVLMLSVVALVTLFHSSTSLASAYGMAVATTMVITTLLAVSVARKRWGWHPLAVVPAAFLLLSVDIGFFGANLLKIETGGWLPLAAGVTVFTLLTTWRRGRELLAARLAGESEPLEHFLARIGATPPVRVPGTAVFMTGRQTGTPPTLLHHLLHNRVLHEQVLLLTVVTTEVPRIPAAERLQVRLLPHGFALVTVRYGFMQSPHIPVALRQCEQFNLNVDLEHTSFYLGRETLLPSPAIPGMQLWRERLFSFLSRNSLQATAFYNIPPERVVELGQQVEI